MRWLLLVLSGSLLGAPSVALGQTVDELFPEGSAARTEGRHVETGASWNRILEESPHNAIADNGLGGAPYYSEHQDEAAAPYRQARPVRYELNKESEPIFTPTPTQTGGMSNHFGYYESAESAYRIAIDLNPKDTSAYIGLGYALNNLGRHQEAMASCQQVLVLPEESVVGPSVIRSHAYGHNCVGLALKALERYDEALAEFQAAIDLAPTWNYPKDNLREVERLIAIENNPTIVAAVNADDLAYVPINDPLDSALRSIVRIAVEYPGSGYHFGMGWVVSRSGNTVLIAIDRQVLVQRGSYSNGSRLSDEIQVDWFSEPPDGVPFRRQEARLLQHDRLASNFALLEVRDAPADVQPLNLSFALPDPLAPIRVISHPVTGNPWNVVRGNVTDPNDWRLQIDIATTMGHYGGLVLDENNQMIGIIPDENNQMSDTTPSESIVANPLRQLRSQLEAGGVLQPLE
jgi:tetratricopeptide (TPR) repeat protein